MNLFNTLTRQIDGVPLDSSKLRVYSCGPTLYDQIHIGNLSSFIFADMLRRSLSFGGSEVQHVMNFTDVDDKTIRRSQEKYSDLDPFEALLKLTKEYADVFMHDMAAAGNDVKAFEFINATDSIIEMQQLITRLHKDGFAYVADDGVYFSIQKYTKSGKKYGQLTEITAASTSEARIQNDEYDKATAHDFALWKAQKPGEPAWDFEIDGKDIKGRPGWHIECSAMSAVSLGQPFDIHTGGVDLVFPHHENEIAQSTAGQDAIYANIFAHNEHLLVDGAKMSKSLDNFYTLNDIKDKGFDPLAFRLLILQSHYRTQAHFSWNNLEAAQNRLNDLRAMAVLRFQARPTVNDAATFALEEVPNQLAEILSHDLNTPQALALLSNVSTQIQAVLLENDMVDHFETMLIGIDNLLGLGLMAATDITDDAKELVKQREIARKTTDWAKSDELRDQLIKQGIGLRDTPSGAIWYRL